MAGRHASKCSRYSFHSESQLVAELYRLWTVISGRCFAIRVFWMGNMEGTLNTVENGEIPNSNLLKKADGAGRCPCLQILTLQRCSGKAKGFWKVLRGVRNRDFITCLYRKDWCIICAILRCLDINLLSM